MAKLFYKDKPIIGLDISQTGVKVMAIDSKKWLVLGYGSADLDPAKVQTSLESNDSYLTDNITSLLREKVIGQLPSDQAIISVVHSMSIMAS